MTVTIKDDRQEILSYLEDASNFKGGDAERLYIPDSEEELMSAVSECAGRGTFVTVSGGGTGTVGGRVPREGAIISLEKFNRILDIEKEKKKAVLQAGVVIKDFLNAIEPYGLFYPPFPTERTAFIGGNAATNASGEYSFRFGPTRRYVKRIRMVLTTGKVLDISRGSLSEKNGIIDYGLFQIDLPSYRTPCIKCSAGYFAQEGMDGIDLLIGSEGTLGIITEVEVSLIDALPPRAITILFFREEEKVPDIVRVMKKSFRELYSLEFFDAGSLQFLKKDFPEIPEGACAVYVETAADAEHMEKLAEIAERYDSADALVGEDKKNYEKLIDFRHRLPENINAYFKKIGLVKVAMDIAVPEDKFPEMYRFYKDTMKREKGMHTILFGHIGENHLHFNLFPADEKQKVHAVEIYETCVGKALSLGGTVAAEHGIGKIKHKWLKIMYGEKGLKEMARIKKAFDPYCILGPDNIFPKELMSM
ncbi:MAG: FAD-binding oxidoreductase [Candidatus Omnitrophica bacterium]|nr:FAD-binding oxidoreductase [Candidatus Omnitrophota bacterium]